MNRVKISRESSPPIIKAQPLFLSDNSVSLILEVY